MLPSLSAKLLSVRCRLLTEEDVATDCKLVLVAAKTFNFSATLVLLVVAEELEAALLPWLAAVELAVLLLVAALLAVELLATGLWLALLEVAELFTDDVAVFTAALLPWLAAVELAVLLLVAALLAVELLAAGL